MSKQRSSPLEKAISYIWNNRDNPTLCTSTITSLRNKSPNNARIEALDLSYALYLKDLSKGRTDLEAYHFAISHYRDYSNYLLRRRGERRN